MLRRVLFLCVFILSLPAPRASALLIEEPVPGPVAQEQAGTLVRGRVLDSSGAPIAGARVSAVPEGAGSTLTATTGPTGEFALTLPAGTYALKAAADNFVEAIQNITALQAGSVTREFTLQVAGFRDAVTVNAEPGYQVAATNSGTRTLTPLRDVPQAITVVTDELIKDQMMMSIGDVVRYVPGIAAHQGENNRDQVIIRGNSSSADFYVNGVRDDVQYYRDLYNLDRVEALKGPNAMIFGRGGGGGVVNRVTKEADFKKLEEVSLQGGEYGNSRISADVNQPLTDTLAVRLNGVYENSDSFRHDVGLERYGISPSLTFAPTSATKVTFHYEHFTDTRVADRGISSFQGVPADVPIDTFYGNPADSHVDATVNLTSATIEHKAGGVTIRNHTLAGDYDRSYQNYVPGAVAANKSQVTLTAYNNATERFNLFNQTDVTASASTGSLKHRLLAGAEIGRQLTDNFRNTGFFNNTATSLLVPYSNPTITTPVTFRQAATDADNHLRTNVAAVYAQDQVEVSRLVQVVGGLRFDRFDLQYHNNRNGDTLSRVDTLVSPRAGLIVKPTPLVSLYTSYSVSYLPSSGDQFSSLTTITQQVEPEKFRNYEVGAKWDIHPDMSVITSIYRLDRTNTRATDPNDPTRIVQTGSQRTNGYELGLNGKLTPAWSIAGGYSYQDAFVTSATTAAREGAQVAQVPHHTLSLWNNYQIVRRVGAGLGLLRRTDMFATIDNTVNVPGYTRVDAAAYVSLTRNARIQVNVENLGNTRYFINADSNTNISPGFPRTVRVGLIAAF